MDSGSDPTGTALNQLLRETARKIDAELSPDNAAVEAVWILEHVLKIHAPKIYAEPNQSVSAQDAARVRALTDAYIAGTPLPYLFGEWYFYGMPFNVTPSVLIPRPETERLVDVALSWLAKNPSVGVFADIGTGSGCITCALLKNCKRGGLRAVMTDVSDDALAVARSNLDRHALTDRAETIRGHLSRPLPAGQHLILANLPYIPSARCETLDVAAHEPRLALDGGPDGFGLIRETLADLRLKVADPFLILCEIDDSHREIAASFSRSVYPADRITIENDDSGRTRYLRIEGAQP